MPQRGNMKRLAQEQFDEPLEVLIPRLMCEHKTPHRVAVRIGVYANSVRSWLISNGWAFREGIWTAPETVANERA